MQARNCRERILRLKAWRTSNGYTVEQCIETCGNFPSDTTVRRIFQKGSEDKSFRESTVAAVELALLGSVYMPEISIPVEDVIEAQKENSAAYNAKLQMEELINAQQKAKLHVCYIMLTVLFAFDVVILLYDVTHLNTGFFNADSIFVWCVQVAFLLVTAITLSTFFIRYWLRKKKIEELEQVAV